MQSTMMDRPLLLDDILERAGTQFGDVEIVTHQPDKSLHRYTYADMVKRAKQLAQALIESGIKNGDRVATFSWNTYAHLEAYFGIPITGAVLHTLNLRLPPDDVAWIVNHAEDRILIIDHGTAVATGTPTELTRNGAENQLRFRAPRKLDLSLLVTALPESYRAVEAAPGEYLVEGRIDPQVLATVTAWCARLDVLATDMRVEQRSLEDVFLRLTGRTLID